MADQYENHKLIYDITDKAGLILSEMAKLSRLIDENSDIPNSLQSTLGKIYRYEGKTQSEISKIYNMDKQNTIKYVSELEKRGYIYKVDLDSKRKGIYLTDKGKKINEHFMKTRGAFLDLALAQISPDHLLLTRQTMEQLCDILITYIEGIE
ncbi:MarR family winged helix-turn-helix transcriptional regulator [Vallitalea okinawensis]|uniref:MarR family winged helix-turn-helix transcriptional regulator n=1 Tax=Vallitalea okinawensis TaxID=2078660 RepID=UPI001300B2EE|nr:winged helix DNA-binding protein [Vallitalea okinawensis]